MSVQEMAPLLSPMLLERAKKLGSALLADGMKAAGGIPNDGCMEANILPIDRAMTMVGTALTVATSDGDNFPIHVATYAEQAGYVMVIDGKACTERAYLGSLIAGAAQAVGFEGIVCDGYVRDRLDCIALGLPIYARGFLQRGPLKKNPGAINAPVSCGGITVHPGDLVVGDCDGVSVVPRDRIEEILTRAEEKLAYEEKRAQSIAQYNACKRNGQPLPQLAPQWVLDMLQ